MAISIVSSIQEEHITVKYIHIGKTKEALLACKIILKIQLVENKEVTLLVELNW